MCQGLNSHYFHVIGDGHQPNSRGLYTHYKDSYWRWEVSHPQYSDLWPWHIYISSFWTSSGVLFPTRGQPFHLVTLSSPVFNLGINPLGYHVLVYIYLFTTYVYHPKIHYPSLKRSHVAVSKIRTCVFVVGKLLSFFGFRSAFFFGKGELLRVGNFQHTVTIHGSYGRKALHIAFLPPNATVSPQEIAGLIKGLWSPPSSPDKELDSLIWGVPLDSHEKMAPGPAHCRAIFHWPHATLRATWPRQTLARLEDHGLKSGGDIIWYLPRKYGNIYIIYKYR